MKGQGKEYLQEHQELKLAPPCIFQYKRNSKSELCSRPPETADLENPAGDCVQVKTLYY